MARVPPVDSPEDQRSKLLARVKETRRISQRILKDATHALVQARREKNTKKIRELEKAIADLERELAKGGQLISQFQEPHRKK